MKKRKSKKLNLFNNLKTNLNWKEQKEGLWALASPILWIIPASLFKLSGYSGLIVSFLSTWLVGAMFNKKALMYSSFGLLATHITYAEGSEAFYNVFKTPIWRMGNTTTEGLSGRLSNQYLQPNTDYINAPDGARLMSRPAPELETGTGIRDQYLSLNDQYLTNDLNDEYNTFNDDLISNTI